MNYNFSGKVGIERGVVESHCYYVGRVRPCCPGFVLMVLEKERERPGKT